MTQVINESIRLTRLINGLGHTLSGATRLTRLTQLCAVGEFFFLVLKLIFNNLKIQIRIKKKEEEKNIN